jgi:hypothetical protein
MEARLQDVLHLVSWNGYSKDIEPSISLSSETWTDDRLMFPFGIQQKYKNGKNRIQILIENNHRMAFNRIKEIQKMAHDSHHMPILKGVLNSTDDFGDSALTAAIKKKSSGIVNLLLDHGVNVNQTNKRGGSPLNLAEKTLAEDKDMKPLPKKPGAKMLYYTMVPSKDAKEIIDLLKKNGAVSIPEELNFDIIRALGVRPYPIIIPRYDYEREYIRNNIMHMSRGRFMFQNDNTLQNVRDPYHDPEVPKPKRLKSSLYKRQFGR